jgi:hypothetical protein
VTHQSPDSSDRPSSAAVAESANRVGVIPNFLYIGTSKAGSTWIYDVLSRHGDVFMASGKGLYFFDNNYDRGVEWYLNHFASAAGKAICGEVSHSYLYSSLACRRIAELNPRMKLMVCLRNPVDRAFSAWLDGIKNQEFEWSFEQALEQVPSLIDRGKYGQYLQPYVEQFSREQIHVAVFDELGTDPQGFADKLFGFLNLDSFELALAMRRKMMPAGVPRSEVVARAAKRTSAWFKRLGLRALHGQLKRSRFVRNLLYRPLDDEDKPQIDAATACRLREIFQADVADLDALLGTSFQSLWGFAGAPAGRSV